MEILKRAKSIILYLGLKVTIISEGRLKLSVRNPDKMINNLVEKAYSHLAKVFVTNQKVAT